MQDFLKRLTGSGKRDVRPQGDPYDPRVELENAGNLLGHHNAFLASAWVFAQLVGAHPGRSLGWYGLALDLYEISGKRGDLALLEQCLACARRSLVEDEANPLAPGLVEMVRTRTPLQADRFDRCEPFDGDPRRLVEEAGYVPEVLVEAVAGMAAWEQRLQAVMWLGDQGSEAFVDLLVHAAERDPHPDVRMGAVKRLRYLPDHPEVRSCLERIVASGSWREIEPYVSMTLGAISRPWAEALRSRIRPDDE